MADKQVHFVQALPSRNNRDTNSIYYVKSNADTQAKIFLTGPDKDVTLTSQDVYNKSGKFLNLYKKILSHSNIRNGGIDRDGKGFLLSFAAIGDSVGSYKSIPFYTRLETLFGTGGTYIYDPNVSGGGYYHNNINDTQYWFNGVWSGINGGSGSLTFGYGRTTSNKITIYYIRETGSGSFQVQIDSGNGFQNEGGVVDTSSSSLQAGIFTIDKPLGRYQVRINGVSGNIKVIGVSLRNYTPNMQGVIFYNLTEGGLNWQNVTTSPAILNSIFQDMEFDLAFLEAKETDIVVNGVTTSVVNNYLWPFIDNVRIQVPKADWVIIGSTPEAQNNSAQQILDSFRFSVGAFERGLFYFDGSSPLVNYAKMVELDWQGDGIHPAAATGILLAGEIWKIIGIDDVFFFSSPFTIDPSGKPILQKFSELVFRNADNDNTVNGAIGADWDDIRIRAKRWHSYTNLDGSGRYRWDPNHGLIVLEENKGLGWEGVKFLLDTGNQVSLFKNGARNEKLGFRSASIDVNTGYTLASAPTFLVVKDSAGNPILNSSGGQQTATLPIGTTTYITNVTKQGESAGTGTGCLCYWDGSNYRRVSNDTVANV